MSCPPLACPLCGTALVHREQRYACANNHSFDIARQGHVHLLPVQHKRSKEPGDSKTMVAARGRFLDAGHYLPLAAALIEEVIEVAAGRPITLLDAGCGEGWYLQQLLPHLAAGSCVVGFDISKWAVQAATRRSPAVHWLVASNRQPPILPTSVDLCLSLFGFPVWAAFHTLLRPNGELLLLDAGPDHLLALRELIYPEVRRKPVAPIDAGLAQGFALQREATLRFTTAPIPQAALADLLAMTPHLHRASATGREAAAQAESLALGVEVVLRRVRKQ